MDVGTQVSITHFSLPNVKISAKEGIKGLAWVGEFTSGWLTHGQSSVLGHMGVCVRWFGFLHNMTAGFL